jgi:hypothetical protein
MSADRDDGIYKADDCIFVSVIDSTLPNGHVVRTSEGIAFVTDEQAAIYEGTSKSLADPKSIAEPPKVADFLLTLFLSEAKGEAAIGDLSERFENDCQRFGAARARRMYWGRALRSLWPLLRRVAARVIKWTALVEGVRRFF